MNAEPSPVGDVPKTFLGLSVPVLRPAWGRSKKPVNRASPRVGQKDPEPDERASPPGSCGDTPIS